MKIKKTMSSDSCKNKNMRLHYHHRVKQNTTMVKQLVEIENRELSLYQEKYYYTSLSILAKQYLQIKSSMTICWNE